MTMSDSPELYDMGSLNWPKEPPETIAPRDTFRSQQVYQCEICHTHTNEWEDRGRYGAHLLCPVVRTAVPRDLATEKPYFNDTREVKSSQQKHHKLLDVISERSALRRKHNLFSDERGTAVPSHVQDELEAVQARIEELREWFNERYDDVVGVGQGYQIQGEFAGE